MDILKYAARIVQSVPAVIPFLSIKAKGALLGYQPIRDNYFAEIYDAVEGYLRGTQPVTSFRNKMSIAMSEAFTDAVYEGYQQAGAELPLDKEVQDWLTVRIGAERENIISLFDRLKKEWDGIDPIAEAMARAEGYARTLDAIYAEAKLRGMSNQMVTWILGQTEKHCDTCAKLAGKKHSIKYLLKNNYIPRKPDAGMDCKGYNCDCRIVDKNGNEVTIAN